MHRTAFFDVVFLMLRWNGVWHHSACVAWRCLARRGFLDAALECYMAPLAWHGMVSFDVVLAMLLWNGAWHLRLAVHGTALLFDRISGCCSGMMHGAFGLRPIGTTFWDIMFGATRLFQDRIGHLWFACCGSAFLFWFCFVFFFSLFSFDAVLEWCMAPFGLRCMPLPFFILVFAKLRWNGAWQHLACSAWF